MHIYDAIYLFSMGLIKKNKKEKKILEQGYQLLSVWPDTFAVVFMEENVVLNRYCSSVSDK